MIKARVDVVHKFLVEQVEVSRLSTVASVLAHDPKCEKTRTMFREVAGTARIAYYW